MNNEIKEILEKLKNKDNDIKGINFLKYQDLTRGEINLLLDYITNLQQDNKILAKRNNELKNIKDERFHNLQQENERLKETNVYCNRTDCIGRIKDSRKYDSVYQEKEDYKSRCEKASEYIKEHYPTSTINDQDDKYNLLNILQNGSEEK